MTVEETITRLIMNNRRNRQVQFLRFSNLLGAIANGTEYEFNPEDASGDGDGVPEQEGEAGAVVGDDSGTEPSGISGGAGEEPTG